MTSKAKSNRFYDISFILYLSVYSFLNYLFLADFPHLNETQAPPGPLLALLEHQLSSRFASLLYVRLPALACSALILALIYALSAYILKSRACGLLAAVPASLCVTFIAAAHQDLTLMVLLLFLLILTFFHVAGLQNLRPAHAVLTGLLIGALSVFSLYFTALFTGFLSLYLFYCIRTRRGARLIIDYSLAFVLSSLVFLVLKTALAFSFPVKPAFPADTSSLLSFKTLFPELCAAGSPAAFAPPAQLMTAVCAACVIAGLYLVLKERCLPIRYAYTAILYILFAMLVPVFVMRSLNPYGALLPLLLSCTILPYAMINAPQRFVFPVAFFLLCCSLAVSATTALPYIREPYAAYVSAASACLEEGAVVLGPYNAYFIADSPKNIVFYRDIPDTARTLPAMRRFIRQSGITYVLFPEELDMIQAASPRLDRVYGPLPYYSTLKQFLENECELAGSFDSSYGMSIARYYWQQPWQVRVYRVRAAEEKTP